MANGGNGRDVAMGGAAAPPPPALGHGALKAIINGLSDREWGARSAANLKKAHLNELKLVMRVAGCVDDRTHAATWSTKRRWHWTTLKLLSTLLQHHHTAANSTFIDKVSAAAALGGAAGCFARRMSTLPF